MHTQLSVLLHVGGGRLCSVALGKQQQRRRWAHQRHPAAAG